MGSGGGAGADAVGVVVASPLLGLTTPSTSMSISSSCCGEADRSGDKNLAIPKDDVCGGEKADATNNSCCVQKSAEAKKIHGGVILRRFMLSNNNAR
jgi:hypothetical protein